MLADLTLKYWYTIDPAKPQELDCDDAAMGCSRLVTSASPSPVQPTFQSVVPPRQEANESATIAFTLGTVAPNTSTGRIQLRLHNRDYSPNDQSDDYSADCGTIGNAHENAKITAYIKGVLVGGTEPP
jgi:hypothetical protein